MELEILVAFLLFDDLVGGLVFFVCLGFGVDEAVGGVADVAAVDSVSLDCS